MPGRGRSVRIVLGRPVALTLWIGSVIRREGGAKILVQIMSRRSLSGARELVPVGPTVPARFGPWKTVYERHRGWSADGTCDRIFAAVLADADAEGRIDWSMVSVNSTSCQAHQHAAGARRVKGARPGSTAPTRDSGAPGAA